MYLVEIYEFFKKSRKSLSVAESCTGGYVSYLLSTYPDISCIYKGAVISYQTEVKRNLLNLKEKEITDKGLVSEEIALSMAKGVRELLKSDWSVSTTGYAGPHKKGEHDLIGKVCFAVAGPDFAKTQTKNFPEDKREKIQQSAASYALMFLYKCLCNKL